MMSRLKKFTFILALLLWATPTLAQNVSRIAAIVNNDVISLFDLQQRINLAIFSSGMKKNQETIQKLAPQILRSLIDERLKIQEAERNKVKVNDTIIKNALNEISQRNKIPNNDILAFMESKGIDGSTLKAQTKTSIAWQELLRRKSLRQGKVSDDEVDEEVSKINANKGKPERLVSEIFLTVDDRKDEPQVKSLANRLLQQIRSGADFGQTAQQFSQSPSAAVAGDLGWVIQGQLGEELEAKLLHMETGAISDPIRSLSGYHILYVRNKRISGSVSENDTKITLEQVVIGVPPKPTQEILNAKMAVAKQVAISSQNCATFNDLGKQVGTKISGSLGTLKLGQLPRPIREKVLTLPINRASAPFVSKDGIMVLMVCKRENPKETNEIVKRQNIKNRLQSKKMGMIDRQLMRDLRRSAFIDIRI
ncbi:MAG: peptidylprolyl isomerase [Rhodospirillales bacterium]|nr:peptidylprolyl isomerase [Rhodospirillales bacterium]